MALKGINIIYIQVGCLIVSLIKLFVYSTKTLINLYKFNN